MGESTPCLISCSPGESGVLPACLSPSVSVALLVECLLGNPEQTAAVCSLFVNDGFLLTSTIDNRATPVGLTQAG